MPKDTENLNRNPNTELPWAIAIGLGLLTLGLSWRLFLAIALTSGLGWLVRLYQRRQQRQQDCLNSLFYKLIQENQGHITALDLAMKAELPGEVVQEFLDRRAKEFAAHYEITDQGGIIYYFPTALSLVSTNTQKSVVSDLELPPIPAVFPSFGDNIINAKASKNYPQIGRKFESSQNQFTNSSLSELNGKNRNFSSLLIPKFLTQVELASRLSVHPSTISKRKSKPDFMEWSREKDPEAIAWKYSLETKRFSPIF